MSHVLIIDDEPAICWGFRELLKGEGHDVSTASSAEDGLQAAAKCQPDAVVLDIRLPGMDGLTALSELKARTDGAPVVVITAFGNLDTAVRALEEGAFDYLTKPFELDTAAVVIRRALEHRANELTRREQTTAAIVPECTDSDTEDSINQIVGKSPAMQAVFKQIALVAGTNAPVLITGESGTGKELVARAIHRHSAGSNEPFLPVSLAAMNPSSAESELFGHVKGAFPGASSTRKGLLELVGSGTVLLDEIGDTSTALQLKLLRTIDHHEILPLGAVNPIEGNFRVVAATNRDLGRLIEGGAFREDLYYRLSVVQIELPPLRDRSEDIPDLARHFLRLVSQNESAPTISSRALLELSARPWPGNVRELRNAVEHAAMKSRGGTIEAEHLPPVDLHLPGSGSTAEVLRQAVQRWAVERLQPLDSGDSEASLYEDILSDVEAPLLEEVLKHCHGNRAATARLLGLHRATLRQKLKNLGLSNESSDKVTQN